MGQIYLPIGTQIKFDTQTYRIISYAGQGGAGLVYCAVNVDEKLGNRIAIRETFPSEGAIRLPNGDIVSTGPERVRSGLLQEHQERVKKALKNAAIAERTTFRVIIPFPALYGPERPAYICLPGSEEYEASNSQYVLMSDATLTGLPLNAYIDAYKASHNGELPLRQVVDIMLSVCEVVKHLHNGDEDGKRLLHGDISYGNIFLSDCDPAAGNCGIARLLDFGESRELKGSDGDGWETDEIGLSDPLGSTSGFMPPEIYYRKDLLKLTAAVDTYALGFLLLSLAKSIGVHEPNYLYSRHYLKRISNSDRERLAASKSAQMLLNRIIDKALQNDCSKRYQTGKELFEDVQHLDDVVGRNMEPTHVHGITEDVFRAYIEKKHNASQNALRPKTISGNVTSAVPQKLVINCINHEREIADLSTMIGSVIGLLYRREVKSVYLLGEGGMGKTVALNDVIGKVLNHPSSPMLPVYWRMKKDMHCFQEHNGNLDILLSTVFANLFFDSSSASIIHQIQDYLTNGGYEKLLLIVDDLHKVDISAKDRLNVIVEYLSQKGVRFIFASRPPKVISNTVINKDIANSAPQDLDLKITEQITSLPYDYSIQIQGVSKSRVHQELQNMLGRVLSSDEQDGVDLQYSVLCNPLFLTRFLELLSENRSTFVLLSNSGRVLNEYFSMSLSSIPAEENSASDGIKFYRLLQVLLPKLAISLHKHGKDAEALTALVSKYNFTAQEISMAVEAGVLSEEGDMVYFAHDVYCDYFASVGSAEIIINAINSKSGTQLTDADYDWQGNEPNFISLFWSQAFAGKRVDADTPEKLFRLVSSKKNVRRLPCNIYRCHKAFMIPSDLAIELLKLSADRGSPSAQLLLGLAYKDGHMVPKDEATAVIWIEKAAVHGDVWAQLLTGIRKKGLPESFQWFRKAASKGNMYAQQELARCYYYGSGTKKDIPKAISYYSAAAEQGLMDAEYELGQLYYRANEPFKDFQLSVFWMEKAFFHYLVEPDQDLIRAASIAHELGQLYKSADETDKNSQLSASWIEKAIHCYTVAANQGIANAAYELGRLYEGTNELPDANRLSVYWMEKAFQINRHVNAARWLGQVYYDGKVVKEDYQLSFEWFKRAAKAGSAHASERVGVMYHLGIGCEIDENAGAEAFAKAEEFYSKTHEIKIEIDRAMLEGTRHKALSKAEDDHYRAALKFFWDSFVLAGNIVSLVEYAALLIEYPKGKRAVEDAYRHLLFAVQAGYSDKAKHAINIPINDLLERVKNLLETM